ncbi:CPBP family intramembrane glutamic endopeptidase [Blastococcus sp. VKM Ac-2987]|uniref:CPBP family intramembrane glutamic endopeptidase n=1 Tax=Blastococcus sp. VKM Ac-2987 TaxID=3004141 RepID=UPI0022AB55DD|nr:type II CAAX endopeptidase family protein [Blastococcus sp. VKM Ac-2987]MCZ2857453.1 type II CAAX endopeptidase family protein [Blastococcus sp. VKM Ac-2987]
MSTRWARSIFWNGEKRRARIPWLIALPLVGAYASIIVAGEVVDGALPAPAQQLVVSGAPAIVAVALILLSRRFLGARRGLADYGLRVDRRWVVDLLAGLGIGVVGVSIPFLIGIGMGWLDVVAVFHRGELALWSGIGLYGLAMLCTGLWEELVLRGVFVCNAADGLRRWLSPRRAVAGGVAVSSIVFGLGHLGQPEIPAFILTWILAGVVFGVIYVYSGNLALAIGAHATYNITYNAGFSRTDIAGSEDLSAITRISPDPFLTDIGPGGPIEIAAFLSVGVLALGWLSLTRGSLTVQSAALGLDTSSQTREPRPTPVSNGRS